MQPPEQLPSVILLDEPELGLHPYAITVLAHLLRAASKHSQVIVCTQSVTLVNQMTPEEEIIVVQAEQASRIPTLRTGSGSPLAGRLQARRPLGEKRDRRAAQRMKHLHVLVEGQTEETFVWDVLAPHLLEFDLFLNPVILTTGWLEFGQEVPGRRGQVPANTTRPVELTCRHAALLRSQRCSTTMAYQRDFPGYLDLPTGSCYDRVRHVEQAFSNDVGQSRFIPFLTLHEFEGLLFTKSSGHSGSLPRSRRVDGR